MTLTTSTDYRIKTLTLAVSADPAPCHTKSPETKLPSNFSHGTSTAAQVSPQAQTIIPD